MVQNEMPFLSEIPDLKNALAGEVVYEAIAEEDVIAFISLWEPDNFIHYLFVNPLYQSKGIGLQLITLLSSIWEAFRTKMLVSECKCNSFL